MPSPAEADKLRLLVGGKVHEDWESYEIDSDLLTPADAWQMSLGLKKGELPPSVSKWAPVEVMIGDDVVLSGRIDTITHDVSRTAHSLELAGRDGAAVLVDCSSPIFVARQVTLEEVIAKVVRPLGITKIRIDADKSSTREKINAEPGDTAWNMLQNAAEANGLWPWFEPDGTLVVGGPDYSKPEVATLIMRRSGKGNNLISLRKEENVTDQFSEITVLGQAHGTEGEEGKHAVKAGARDKSVGWYRPKIVVDHETDNDGLASDRARKVLADGRLSGLTFTAKVSGHRASDGVVWAPGQRVRLVSEPHQVDAVFFLMSRKFRRSRSEGTTTELTLKEDGVWTLDAHPHKRKHRRGKNDAGFDIL